MALQTQLLDFPLFGGRNHKLSKYVVSPPDMRQMVNCFEDQDGGVRRRRYITDKTMSTFGTLPTGATFAAAMRQQMFKRGEHLLVGSSEGSLAEYNAGRDAWRVANGYRPCALSTRTVRAGNIVETPSYEAVSSARLTTGGVTYTCTIYENTDANGAVLTTFFVIDSNGNAVTSGALADARKTRVLAFSSSFGFVYHRPAATTALGYATLTNLSSGTPTLTTVSSDLTGAIQLDTDGFFDAVETPGITADTFALTFVDSNQDVEVQHYSSVGILLSTTAHTTTTNSQVHIFVGGDAGAHVYVAFVNETATRIVTLLSYDNTFTIRAGFPAATTVDLLNATVAQFMGGIYTPSALHLFTTNRVAGGESTSFIQHTIIQSDGTAGAPTTCLLQAEVAGHAFIPSIGGVCVPVCLPLGSDNIISFAPQHGTLSLLQSDTSGNPLSLVARLFVDSYHGPSKRVPRAYGSGDAWHLAFNRIDNLRPGDNVTKPGFELSAVEVNFDLSPARKLPSFEHSDVLYIGGGHLMAFDGLQCVESGFFRDYMKVGDFAESAAGGQLSDLTYGFAFLYTYLDRFGNLHRSAPVFLSHTMASGGTTQSVTIDNGAGGNFIFNLGQNTGYGLTYKNGPTIEIYRTTGDGSQYFLEERIANAGTQFSACPTLGTLTDVALVQRQPLYTTGELPATCPPTIHHVMADGDMAILVPADNRKEVWLSKPFVAGIAPEFTNRLAIRIPEGQDIEAGWLFDEQILTFHADQIRRFTGSKPAANGFGVTGESIPVEKSYGCVDWRSIIEIPPGLLFKSPQGWCLLNKGLQTALIGLPVGDFDVYDVHSVTHLPKEQQVRILLADSSVLVFDYRRNTWAVFTYDFLNVGFRDAIELDGFWLGLAAEDGAVYTEVADIADCASDDAGGVDPGATGSLLTPHYKLGSLAGFQRVRKVVLHGESTDAGRDVLYVDQFNDFNESAAVATLVNIEEVFAAAGEKPVTVRLKIIKQKCGAVQFQIDWASTTPAENPSNGIVWTGLSLEIGVKRGMRRSPEGEAF